MVNFEHLTKCSLLLRLVFLPSVDSAPKGGVYAESTYSEGTTAADADHPGTFNRPMWNVPTLADLLQRLSVKKPPKAAGILRY